MEIAARRKSSVVSPTTADIEHRPRRFYGSKVPSGELLSEMSQLCASSRADTENSRVYRQVGKHRLKEKVQPITDRSHLCPLLIIASSLLIERRLKLFALHLDPNPCCLMPPCAQRCRHQIK